MSRSSRKRKRKDRRKRLARKERRLARHVERERQAKELAHDGWLINLTGISLLLPRAVVHCP